jgi:hypothetical protein
MPSLTFEEVTRFSEFKPKVFIETGTYLGDTINNMLPYFDKLYSIELSPHYTEISKNRFKNNNNVSIITGDSSEVLNSLSKLVKESVFFWLDGHWSGGNTARGKKDCPLIEELNEIMTNFKSKCVVAIDDIRLFGTNINEDWHNITREVILKIVENRLESCKYYPSNMVPEDRMVLILKELE